jgi:arginine deiminase
MTSENRMIKVGVKAEYDPARTIIMHTPGDELFYGCLQNTAALFEDEPFDRFEVIKEHKEYVEKLKELGINVILIKDILLQGTIDSDGKKKPGPELDQLVTFAEDSSSYAYPLELSLDEHSEMKDYKKQTMQAKHPHDLFKTIILKPDVTVKKSDENNSSLVVSSYSLSPVMNLHFLRDQQITTDLGVIIGKMNSTQRKAETEITKFALHKLGAEIVYAVKDSGRLEGGDFIPCGDYAFIGQGLRTNNEGVLQLLNNKALGYKEVAVVKDPFQKQDEMHLDTYFNIVGPNRAIILEDRVNHYDTNGTLIEADPHKRSIVDIYHLEEEGYIRKRENVCFQEYLSEKGFIVGEHRDQSSLTTLTKKEQLNYGVNVLTISENRIIAVKDVSHDYLRKMEGIEVIEVNLKNFVKTFGAPHCATQVVYRDH